MVDFVVLGFAPVVKIVYLFLGRLRWLQNGIVFIADQLLWRFNQVWTLWQISYQAVYLFNFSLQFISDFLMLGRNAFFQIFLMLLTVSGSEDGAIFVAELRSCVALACHTPSSSPIQHCKNRTTFFIKTYQLSDHQVDFESVSAAFPYFQRIFSKEKYRLSFMGSNCHSGGNSPRVQYCALAQNVSWLSLPLLFFGLGSSTTLCAGLEVASSSWRWEVGSSSCAFLSFSILRCLFK